MRNLVSRAAWIVTIVVASVYWAQAAGPPTPKAAQPAPTAQQAPGAPTPRPQQATTQAAPPAAGIQRGTARARAATSAEAPVNDTAIENAIQSRFARSKISTNGFTVRVQGGVAILEGKTGVIQHKGTATRLAKKAGARRVDNRIQISDAARQKAIANLAKVSRN